MYPFVIIVAFVIIVVSLLILAFFILGSTVKDLRETRKKIKQNEEEIRKMIYGH